MTYKSTEDYLNEWINANTAQKNAAIANINKTKTSALAAIDEQANKKIDDYEKVFNEDVTETEVAAEDSRKKNAINRALNERYINERMANLGLSDSGYANVSQMGAEAYYQNTSKEIAEERQKAIDTLAATLKQNKENTDLWRTEEKRKVESNARQDIDDIEQKFVTDAEKYASDMHKLDMEAREDKFDLLENYNKKVEDEKGDIVDFWSGEQKNYYVTAYAEKYGLDRALAELPKNIAFTELTKDWGKREWWEYMRDFQKGKSNEEAYDEYELIKDYIPKEYRPTVQRAIYMATYGG